MDFKKALETLDDKEVRFLVFCLFTPVCNNTFNCLSAESSVDAMAKVTTEENSENLFDNLNFSE